MYSFVTVDDKGAWCPLGKLNRKQGHTVHPNEGKIRSYGLTAYVRVIMRMNMSCIVDGRVGATNNYGRRSSLGYKMRSYWPTLCTGKGKSEDRHYLCGRM